MDKDKALDLALEALEYIENNYMSLPKSGSEAITAIKQARSAPVQEPVATLWQHGETGRTRITMPGDITDCDARWFKAADLYTTPPAAQRPVAEPHKWVGLTPREIYNLWEDSGVPFVDWDSFASIAQAIQAKLKEKNT